VYWVRGVGYYPLKVQPYPKGAEGDSRRTSQFPMEHRPSPNGQPSGRIRGVAYREGLLATYEVRNGCGSSRCVGLGVAFLASTTPLLLLPRDSLRPTPPHAPHCPLHPRRSVAPTPLVD